MIHAKSSYYQKVSMSNALSNALLFSELFIWLSKEKYLRFEFYDRGMTGHSDRIKHQRLSIYHRSNHAFPSITGIVRNQNPITAFPLSHLQA